LKKKHAPISERNVGAMGDVVHKSICVVFTRESPRRFLTVCDRRFRDWTFVTGGCRKKEVYFPLKTALRELEEESRGLLRIHCGQYHYFYLNDIDYPDSIYHVYAIEIDLAREHQVEMERRFDEERERAEERRRNRLGVRRSHDENIKLSWDTLVEFRSKPKWGLIERMLLSPRFLSVFGVNETEKKIPFDLSVRAGGGNARHSTSTLHTGGRRDGCAGAEVEVDCGSERDALRDERV